MDQVQKGTDLIKSFLLISLISLCFYWLWLRRALFKFSSKFPNCVDLSIGMSVKMIRDFKGILKYFGISFERSKSNTMCIWFGIHPHIISTDLKIIEKVLSSTELVDKSETFYTPIYKAFGGGIISSPASVWRHKRKIINPSFNYKVLQSFTPVFHTAKNTLLSKFDEMANNGEYKLCDMIHNMTLGITVETTMGKVMRPGDEVDEEIIHCFKFVTANILYDIMLSSLNLEPLFMLHYKFQRLAKHLRNFVLELVIEKLRGRNNSTNDRPEVSGEKALESIKKSPNIFIDQAIENFRKQQLSYEDIVVESNNIVAASFETTANGIHSTLVMLAMHPDIQERVYEEIINVFPEKNFKMGFTDFEQLPYLDMVIKETLRLAPSIPLIGRHITKNLLLSNDFMLPKDLQVIISIFHLHRRKDIWGSNANNFDPDNFLPENIATKHPYAYIPFSKGIRNCIGWRYALFAMKVILSGLVRNYRFTTSSKYADIEFTFHITLKYLNDPSFKIYRRE